MNADQLVSAVRESAQIDTTEHAQQAVQATLTVLGQRLSTEAAHLAAQLPPQFGECLTQSEQVERFGLDEFYQRVGEQEGRGCSAQEARRHARAVTAALKAAVGPEYLHVLDQLPDDYADLMHTENVQH
ncbi:MAG: DUF2267 domain-containing protein [Aldersonia sp.]|nr:DUF2267 domain-containing protein [Aldersonia sp.]